MPYVDIWDGEWDDFKNDVVELATTWIRLFYKRFNVNIFNDAFSMERVIEQIRVNARKLPPMPWSDYALCIPIPFENPFIERIHYSTSNLDRGNFNNEITRGIYILRHPCIILINIFRMYKALVKKTRDPWETIRAPLFNILKNYRKEINDSYDTMSFESKRRNEETGRYTYYGVTAPLNNTSNRSHRLNARRKNINMTRERQIVRANERIATLRNNEIFEWSAEPSDPIAITSPTDVPQMNGVYGALVSDIEFVQLQLSQEKRTDALEENNYLY